MLYMKEMRSKVISECTLKESAAINQILGKRVSHFPSPVFVSQCVAMQSCCSMVFFPRCYLAVYTLSTFSETETSIKRSHDYFPRKEIVYLKKSLKGRKKKRSGVIQNTILNFFVLKRISSYCTHWRTVKSVGVCPFCVGLRCWSLVVWYLLDSVLFCWHCDRKGERL